MYSLTLLRPEYEQLWNSCELLDGKISYLQNIAEKISQNKSEYQTVSDLTNGIPWYFIGIIHSLECNLNFKSHLHNGDPLTARTVLIPAGHPVQGNPPFSWIESAVDALKLKSLHKRNDWSIPAMLFQWEQYNGWGYRMRPNRCKSPYLWSFTNHYSQGKFVADGKYSSTAVSEQCGAAALLKILIKKHNVIKTESIELIITQDTWLKSNPEQATKLSDVDKFWLPNQTKLIISEYKLKENHLKIKIESSIFKDELYVFCDHTNFESIASNSDAVSSEATAQRLDIKTKLTFAQKIVAYMKMQGYYIASEIGEINIVYVEGVDKDGIPNADALNVFNDRRIIIDFKNDQPFIIANFLATTEPSKHYTMHPMNQKGAARIQFNQFQSWAIGFHNGDHEALIQVQPVTVHRDLNKDGFRTNDNLDTGLFGINQHHGWNASVSNIGKTSAGCLVDPTVSGHQAFMRFIKQDPRIKSNPDFIFHTTIIPGDKLAAL